MKKRLIPFLCGGLTAAICVSTALASGGMAGTVLFNAADFFINGIHVLASGETMTTAKGAEVPTSILYTDEYGDGTYYVPVRPLTEALAIPVEWDSGTVIWNVDGELEVNMLPLSCNGAVFDGYMEEVQGVIPEEHRDVENYTSEVEPIAHGGNTVSVTVTNKGRANIVFRLGIKKGDLVMAQPTKVPAGETVTRTFRLLSDDNGADTVPWIELGNARDVFREHKFIVTAVQFDAEYEEVPKTENIKIDIGGSGSNTEMTIG